MIEIIVNGKKFTALAGKSILAAALDAGMYIPHLCHHPQFDFPPDMVSVGTAYQVGLPQHGEEGVEFEGCNLCLVEIQGETGPVQSCKTRAEAGMVVSTDTEAIQKAREANIARILETHPHVCLLCSQSAGCDRKICSLQIPEAERCCFKFGNCELQKVAGYIGINKGLPPYIPPVKIQGVDDEPLFKRNYDLCIGCLRCVRICKEIKGADALCFTNEAGRVTVGSKGPTLKESGCHFCGLCVEVCPTGALWDKDLRAGKRENSLVPCRSHCPAEIDVPRYVRFVAAGKFAAATGVVREQVPFPAVLGRVCFHPCETVCRRASLDEPVAICALKRAAAGVGELPFPLPAPQEKTGKKVAVLGSGPAGLTAAYYLNSLGHSVTVFEALPEAGGMLRVGIPAFRLPEPVLDREIKAIEDAGVTIRTGSRVEGLDKLFAEGFQAVFVAIGAHQGMKMGIPGENAEGVIDGVAFLRTLRLGQKASIGKKVALIGGGNVALDSARSALRSGAQEATVFYRRTREEMPAYDEEIEAALEEGVRIEYQASPRSIEKTAAGLTVQFTAMEMGDPDESGRRRPVPKAGSEYALSFDSVIAAIGQKADVPEGVGMTADASPNRLAVETARGVFIGGDLLTGPRSVIDAIASGRKGASLIDKFLGGEGNIDQVLTETGDPLDGVRSLFVDRSREAMPMLRPAARCADFPEVNLGFDDQTAIAEAARCLGCDLRFQIKPAVMPPESCLILAEENIQDLPEGEGVYLLYDGAKEVYKISGVENLRQALLDECDAGSAARYFSYEEDPMFTMKERQLMQQYMKKSGAMPPGNMELDDLF